MRTRRLGTVLLTGAGILLLAAGPAGATTAGGAAGWGLGKTLLVTIGSAVGICLVISLAVAAPALLRRPRYRPGRPWPFAPVWFGAPGEADGPQHGVRAPAGTGGTNLHTGGSSAEW